MVQTVAWGRLRCRHHTPNKKNQTNEIATIAKGNCGIPSYQKGKIVYSCTQEIMSRCALMAFAARAKIIGGFVGQRLYIFERRETRYKNTYFRKLFRR